MKIYLSGINALRVPIERGEIDLSKLFALESFYSFQDWELKYIPKMHGFLLDSGAFTFMSSVVKHGSIDWLSYSDRYADFIRDNNIKNFFELDIDSIVGLDYTERLRDRIERRVGWQSIPVWHPSRGGQYWKDMCKEYGRVAVGGIAAKEAPRAVYERAFPSLLSFAKEREARVHGLGYTDFDGLKRYRFDSVDSTTWLSASRFHEVAQFNKDRVIRVVPRKMGKAIKSAEDALKYSFFEWQKYSDWAYINI